MNTYAYGKALIVTVGILASVALLAFSATASAEQVYTPPSCSIYATASSGSGQPVTLSWNSSNATSAFLSPDFGGVLVEGSKVVYPTMTTTYTLAVHSAQGLTSNCQVTVYVSGTTGAPYCTISANPSNINYNNSSTLTWNSTNAVSANLTNIGSVALSGSQSVSPSGTTTYVLTVYNSQNQSAQCQTTVTVGTSGAAPSCWITLSSQYGGSYQYNQPATLSWGSTNANSASISPNVGSIGTSGSQTVYPGTNQIYTMTVYNSQGQSATCQTSAYYSNLYCTITANPQTVSPGGTTNLSWTSYGATSAWLSEGIGSVSLNDSRTVYPQSSRNYTLNISDNQGRTQTCNAYVSVTGTTYYPGPTYPYPPVIPPTNISLDQIPYTGFDMGAIGNTLYWFAIALFAVGAGYMVVYYAPRFWGSTLARQGSYQSVEQVYETADSVEVPAMFRSESQNFSNRN